MTLEEGEKDEKKKDEEDRWFREKQAELERKAEIKAIEKQVKEMQVNNEREYRKALANDAFNLWLDIKNRQRAYETSIPGQMVRYGLEMKRSQVPWRPPTRDFVPRIPSHQRRSRRRARTADRVVRPKSVF
ncbi:unnamed protein product [Enterobius vermicularis]|uniref:Clathrin light chain n=1 Tax=Enterobius vermicularis TaxID=51028 RepID=A0A0N4VPA7_ENTVE|nr:unnamed protein product [Enterobius vermicularis]